MKLCVVVQAMGYTTHCNITTDGNRDMVAILNTFILTTCGHRGHSVGQW